MDNAQTISIEPLSKVLGARIVGLDLRLPVDVSLGDVLREAFSYYSVLCLSDQEIEADHQADFASLFGKVDRSPHRPTDNPNERQSTRGVMYVSNIKRDGKHIGVLPDGEMHFHSDGSHRENPYRATSLYAIKVPSSGGQTMFANLAAAYDHLEEATKQRLEGLTANHVFNYNKTRREDIPKNAEAYAEHPLVRTHPITGRKSLYLSRLMTARINGLEEKESEELLLDLLDHCESPEFVYTHEWVPGDLIIWDNRSVNHARKDFPREQERLLRRFTVSEPGTSDDEV
ncbi:MAG: TauD/TfdA family dioxygenase [Pseudomonadota bacterium]|nr:TauD/TfdA family dioxygenase [Pseudomonadota bacterium]